VNAALDEARQLTLDVGGSAAPKMEMVQKDQCEMPANCLVFHIPALLYPL